MIRAGIVAALLATPAWAGCPAATPDRGQAGAPVAASEGLAVSRAGQALRIGTTEPDGRISAEAGLLLVRRDGTECVARIAGGDARQIRIDVPLPQLAAIEAGVCLAGEGVCVPVRVELPPRR